MERDKKILKNEFGYIHLVSTLQTDTNTYIHVTRIIRISMTSVSNLHLSMVRCRISHCAVADHVRFSMACIEAPCELLSISLWATDGCNIAINNLKHEYH